MFYILIVLRYIFTRIVMSRDNKYVTDTAPPDTTLDCQLEVIQGHQFCQQSIGRIGLYTGSQMVTVSRSYPVSEILQVSC